MTKEKTKMLVMKNSHYSYQERYTGERTYGQRSINCEHCGHCYKDSSPMIRLISDPPNFLGYMCRKCSDDWWTAGARKSEFIEIEGGGLQC